MTIERKCDKSIKGQRESVLERLIQILEKDLTRNHVNHEKRDIRKVIITEDGYVILTLKKENRSKLSSIFFTTNFLHCFSRLSSKNTSLFS